jgi:hypothetical protein
VFNNQAQVPSEAVKVDVKAAEDVASWGATKRRTTQPKPREATSGSSESQADSQTVSTNSSVASNQTGNPARPKPHARSKVVKKEKEQTLTATLTERSEVLSNESWISLCFLHRSSTRNNVSSCAKRR